MESAPVAPDRRRFLAYFSGVGLTSTLLPGVLWAQLEQSRTSRVSKEMLAAAETIAGMEFTDAERESMVQGLNENLERYDEVHKTPLRSVDAPAQQFSPILPGMTFDKTRRPF